MNDHDIELDLFETRDNTRAADPRYAQVETPETQWPILASPERMMRVFETVVMEKGATAREIERFTTTGTHIDPVTHAVRPGHRTRVEYGSRPLAGFVGVVAEAHWAIQVLTMIDPENQTTFISGLKGHDQTNGDWTPMKVQTRIGKEITRNGRRVSTVRPGPEEQMVWHKNNTDPAMDATNLAIDVMEYAIVWVDRRNAKDMAPVDAQGRPIGETHVTVQTGSDPALVAAIKTLAERNEPKAAPQNTDLADKMDRQTDAIGSLAASVKALAERPEKPIEERRKPGRPPVGRTETETPSGSGSGSGEGGE